MRETHMNNLKGTAIIQEARGKAKDTNIPPQKARHAEKMHVRSDTLASGRVQQTPFSLFTNKSLALHRVAKEPLPERIEPMAVRPPQPPPRLTKRKVETLSKAALQ